MAITEMSTKTSAPRSRRAARWWRRGSLNAALVAGLAGLGVVTAAPADAVVQIGDGGFEYPVVPAGTPFVILTNGQSIGPWTVRNTVDLNGPLQWQAAEGRQSVDLNGSGAGNFQGAVYQTIPTHRFPLRRYLVTYRLAGNPEGGPRVKTGVVRVNGVVEQTFAFDTAGKTTTNMGYVKRGFFFRPSGPFATLEFASTTDTSSPYGPVIDDVRVYDCLLVLCRG